PLARLRLTNPLVLSAIILAIAPFWQLRFGVNGDASWIITMCERVLAGDRLYVDLIETNPPFTIWMFMPAVLLARMLGVSPEFMMHLYAYVACIGGLAFAGAIVRRANLPERDGLFAILPVMVGLLVLFPGNSFAEREHLGIALLLPLLALMAWRTTDPSARPGIGWSLPAGLLGSVIVLIKPYYVLMILVPAVWSAWRRRSLAGLFEPEYWAAGLACLVYLFAVLTLHPEFMADVYPLLRDTYMRTSRPLFVLQIYGPTIAIIGYLIYRYRAGTASSLVALAILAGAAGLVPLVYQGKGWAYHAYPSLFLLLTTLTYLFRQAISCSEKSKPGLVGILLMVVTFVVASVPFQVMYRADENMLETVRASAPDNPGVALIGAGIEAGHPFTRLVGGHWI
ncbi:hypothetical protein BMP26_005301, partial [Escherichia coli]|nr:hypothetical protein [Escherichia coli]